MLRRVARVALVATFTLHPFARARVAAAQSNAGAAERLFRDARARIAQKDYAAACPMLEESLRLDPAPGTEFNLARCYELEGHLASAARAYGHVADTMRAGHQLDREKVARERLLALTPRLAFVTVTFPPDAPASETHAQVTLDGRELTPTELAAPFAVDEGDRTVAVAAPGKRPWQITVHVAREATGGPIPVLVPRLEDVAPAIPATPAPPAPEPAPTVTPPPSESPAAAPAPIATNEPRRGIGAARAVAIGAGGGALVAAGIGAYFGVRAFQLKDDYASSRTDGDISTVSFVVTGVLVATGAVLWLTSPPAASGPRAPSGPRVVVAPGTSPRAALWIAGEF
jgi:hypothetical protein